MGDTLNSIMSHRFETWQKNWPCDTDIDHPVGEIVPNRFLFNKRFQCSYVTIGCKDSSSFDDTILDHLNCEKLTHSILVVESIQRLKEELIIKKWKILPKNSH